MSKSSATHTSHCGSYLYRVIPRRWWQLWPSYTGVEFWDTRTDKWRESAMEEHELMEIPTHETK